jgi:hypothetical protein
MSAHVGLPRRKRRPRPTYPSSASRSTVRLRPTRRCIDPSTGEYRRHHLHETVIQRGVRSAAIAAGIPKRISPHTLRSPPTCLNRGPTSERSRNSWATRISPRPWSTPLSCAGAPLVSRVRWIARCRRDACCH